MEVREYSFQGGKLEFIVCIHLGCSIEKRP